MASSSTTAPTSAKVRGLLPHLADLTADRVADALYGIADLLKRHPTALTGHLGLVMEGVLPLAVDEVRPFHP